MKGIKQEMKNLKKMMLYIKRFGVLRTIDRIGKKAEITDALFYEKRRYEKWRTCSEEDYPKELKKWYKEMTGKTLDLENPITFNEKMQWLKLYDSTELKTLLADKYLMRKWIKEQIGDEYLIPLLGVWDSFDEIQFEQLPEQFALKANHGSGWNIIVTNKANLDIRDAKSKFDDWLGKNFAFISGLELHYKNIKPKIIAEKYIENVNGLVDYRFYCFNGQPKQVWVDIFSGTSNHKREIYDMNWKKLPIKCTWPSADGLLDEQPKNFCKMKEFAAKLSSDFKFVRVDFFEVDEQLYMGEMTFIPMGGIGCFEPDEWDTILGNMIVLTE